MALQTLVPGCGEGAALALRRGATVAEAVGELLDELDAEERPASVLVIDDLQIVDNEKMVATSLALFAQHLPAWLHLVLLSRREPNLPRDRLRARGQLGEVHFAELRFTPAEARELMSRLASPAPDDRIESPQLEPTGGRPVCSWPPSRRARRGLSKASIRRLAARSSLYRTTYCARCSPPNHPS